MEKRALISVSDKTGVVEFAKNLHSLGYQIISTGGTEAELKKAGLPVTNISVITGFPECLDGRVKTLHPAVHAGLLAMRDNPDHMKQLQKLNLKTIDVVAVNLYPFAQTIARQDCTRDLAVENIDIGGPTMLRSAAKNYKDVVVAVDPADYDGIVKRLGGEDGGMTEDFRLRLMYKVYRHTAHYDTVIADYLMGQAGIEMPEMLTLAYEKSQDLRYGENPHQAAAFYRAAGQTCVSLSAAKQLQGKELSYNNINDAAFAIELVREFDKPAVAAIKHANPCGVAVADNVFDAYKKAYDCDPVSIFGGIVAINRRVDKATASEMVKTFLEIVVAPDFDEDALQVFTQKPNLRVLRLEGLDTAAEQGLAYKFVDGGLLCQSKDSSLVSGQLKVVTKAQPTKSQLDEAIFAYTVVKHVKSNAIVLSKDFAAVGVGAGQTNRVWAAQQAADHAGDRAQGAVAASDAFFPFADSIQALAAAGVKCIIQPGGSVRDGESIDECDKHGIAMVFAGNRHFRH